MKLDTEAILRDSAGHTPGRPDVARALLAARVVTSLREAFDRFLKDGGPADVPVGRLGLAEGVALGRACGAKLSIAHPHTLRSFAIVGEFYRRHRAAGLDGIEALYGRYGAREQQTWLRMAEDLDLVVTGGSDFHGASAPEVPRPVIDVPARYAGVSARGWSWRPKNERAAAEVAATRGRCGEPRVDHSRSLVSRPSTVFLASPKSMRLFSLKKSGFSTPA